MSAYAYSPEHMLDCLMEVRLCKADRDTVSYLYAQYCRNGRKLNEAQHERVFNMFSDFCEGDENRSEE
jgi:hypothetical protein